MFDRPVAEKFQIGLMSLRRTHLHLAHTCPGCKCRGVQVLLRTLALACKSQGKPPAITSIFLKLFVISSV